PAAGAGGVRQVHPVRPHEQARDAIRAEGGRREAAQQLRGPVFHPERGVVGGEPAARRADLGEMDPAEELEASMPWAQTAPRTWKRRSGPTDWRSASATWSRSMTSPRRSAPERF